MTRPALPRDRVLQPALPENASIKLIGLGGIGGVVARYGAVFLASLQREARLVLIDGDSFEPSNVTRMLFGSFGNKATVLLEELLPRFAESCLALLAIEEYVTPENITRLVQEEDIVVLTVDNHATRKLVNDYCGQLRNVCLISGGNDGVETDSRGVARRGTYGNVQVYLRRDGEDFTPALGRYHPEIARPADRLPTDQSCIDLVTTVPQLLFSNLAVASAILNTLCLYLCGALHYSELALDIADGLMRPAISLPQFAPAPVGLLCNNEAI